ncbi:MAG: hypothetical protein JXB44_11730 [Calditrichaceae bacterium]|nr:hypothetical protein [Calditrichaceae bacterium]RQV93490.1 MAG: hypothetical protein EH224_12395 [Calditrichota bacterium]
MYFKNHVFMKVLWVIIALRFTGLGSTLSADQLELERISTKQGLSQSTITSICQDSCGFLWFGSYNGLNRYDGYTFEIFKHDPFNKNSLTHDFVRVLTVDKKGRLWIGTAGGGLNLYDPRTEKFLSFQYDKNDSNSLSQNSITALLTDKSGNLWIGTSEEGINVLKLSDAEEKLRDNDTIIRFKKITHKEAGVPESGWNRITSFYEDQNGYIWIGTRNGLSRYNPTDRTFNNYFHQPYNPHSLNTNDINCINEDKYGNLWIGTWDNGLNKYLPKSGKFIRYPFQNRNNSGPSYEMIMYLFKDKHQDLWIGTWGGGINKLETDDRAKQHLAGRNKPDQFIHYKDNPRDIFSIADLSIYSIFEDRSGVIWIGSDWNGLYKYTTGYYDFKLYSNEPNDPNTLNQKNVFHLFKDRDGILWIGTRHGGVNLFDRKNNRYQYLMNNPNDPNTVNHNKVRVIFNDRKDNLWIGTEIGLDQYDRARKRFIHHILDTENPYGINVFCISDDRFGNLWIGTYGLGLYKYDLKSRSIKNYVYDAKNPFSIGDNIIWRVYEDRKGNLWIATDNGGLNLYDYENDRFVRYKKNPENPNSLSSNKVLTIFEDSSGQIWLGTTAGLNKMKYSGKQNGEPTSAHYTTRDGLPTNTIHGMLEDDHGNLWISTNNGLSKFDPQEEIFVNFDETDGLQDKEFSVNSCYKDTVSGEFYFGGINGFNVFHPDSIRKNTILPEVVLTGLKIFNKKVAVGEEINGRVLLDESITYASKINLLYAEGIFTIEFSALHFISPDNNLYSYRLEGFEDSWNYVDARQRMATYTNLDPGKYVFRMRAANNDRIWNNEEKSLTIIISPPFWQTWWFRITVLIFIVGLIIFVINFRTRLIRSQNKELEKRVSARTFELEQLNKELEAFTYSISHDLRAPLRGMSGFSEVILEDYGSQINNEIKSYLKRIQSAAQRMGKLIDDLLNFTRLSHGRMHLKHIDLSALTASIIDEIKQHNPNLQFNIEIEPNLKSKADEGLIKIAIANLINNALKFTSKRTDAKIEVGKAIYNGREAFFIKDNGIGFEETYADKLFDIFQRHNIEFEGTGIGLAVVKRIIDRHGGQIWAEGKPDQGAVFYFTLGEALVVERNTKDHRQE